MLKAIAIDCSISSFAIYLPNPLPSTQLLPYFYILDSLTPHQSLRRFRPLLARKQHHHELMQF